MPPRKKTEMPALSAKLDTIQAELAVIQELLTIATEPGSFEPKRLGRPPGKLQQPTPAQIKAMWNKVVENGPSQEAE